MANKAAKGWRAKTRNKISSDGSKTTISKILKNIPVGSIVDIVINASIHKGMPFRRYHGMTGKVSAKQGKAYIVDINEGNKEVEIVTTAAHLVISKGAKQPEAQQEVAVTKKAKVKGVSA